jgi:shikimate 5-dehydrogenase
MIILQTVGLLGRVISTSQGLYLNTGQHKHRINTCTNQTFMLCVGFEITIPVSERAKTVHALDRLATVTGSCNTLVWTKMKLVGQRLAQSSPAELYCK